MAPTSNSIPTVIMTFSNKTFGGWKESINSATTRSGGTNTFTSGQGPLPTFNPIMKFCHELSKGLNKNVVKFARIPIVTPILSMN